MNASARKTPSAYDTLRAGSGEQGIAKDAYSEHELDEACRMLIADGCDVTRRRAGDMIFVTVARIPEGADFNRASSHRMSRLSSGMRGGPRP